MICEITTGGIVIVYLSSAVSVFLLAQWKSLRTTCMTSF